MANLDPKLLQQLLALQNAQGVTNGDHTEWDGPDGYRVWRGNVGGHQVGGQSGYYDPGQIQTLIYHTLKNGGDWGNTLADVYDAQGNGIGQSSGEGEWKGLLTHVVLPAIAGAYSAPTGGAESGAAVSGMDMAADNPALWDQFGQLGSGADAATSAAWTNGAGLGKDTVAASGGGTAATLGNGASTLKTGADLASTAKTGADVASGANTLSDAGKLVTLAGGVAGALDSKDKEQTSTRDPWAPMQPYLLGLADDGRSLYNQYKAQPFSDAQQKAYGNVGGLLDSLNGQAPALMGLLGQLGQNQFVRGQRNQTPAGQGATLNWSPGLLGNFGTGGK